MPSSTTDTQSESEQSHSAKEDPGIRRFVPAVVRQSLALKLAFALLLMGATVGIAGGLSTMETRAQFKQDVDDEYASIAEREAADLGRWHQRNVDFVEVVSLSTGVQSEEATVAQEEFTEVYAPQFRQFARNSQYSPNLYYTNVNSDEIVASTLWDNVGDPLSELDDPVRDSLTGSNTHVTVPYNSTTRTGETVARIAYVTQVPNQPEGYVVFTVPLDAYSGELAGGDDEHTTVVDADDRKIMTEQGTNLLTPYAEANSVTQQSRALAGNASGATTGGPTQGLVGSSESESLIGQEYVVGYSRVPGTDWSVLVHVDADQVYGPVVSAANRGFAATIVGVLFIVVAGAFVGRSLTTSLNQLTARTREMKTGDLDVELSSVRVDAIGELYVGVADMRDALKAKMEETESARKEAEVSRAEAMEMNDYLEGKAEEFSRAMEATAAGDMTQRMDRDGENDSIDRIAREFNAMIEELEKTTGQLKTFADEVADSGTVLLTSAESVRDASEQVATSIQKISDDAYEQRDRLSQVSEDLDALVETLDRVDADNPDVDFGDALDQFRTVATTLQEAAATSDGTMAEAENVAGAAEEQSAELNEVSNRADRLKRYASPLGNILNRFETEAEHEFVFSGGPSQSRSADDD